MHDPESAGILDDILRQSTVAIFAHYGVALEAVALSVARSLPSPSAIGVIGFTGDRVRGTVAIAASAELLAVSRPDTGATSIPHRDLVRDWIGELANLLLGRICLAFARHGLEIRLSTPVAVSGQGLHVGAAHPQRTRCWDFTSPPGAVRAWIEVELDPGMRLDPVSADGADALQVGEPVLF